MNDEPGRLVDDNQVAVLVDDDEGNGLGFDVIRNWRREL